MDSHTSFLLNLVVVIGAATLVATVFHALRLPLIVSFLVTGVAVGPKGLAFVKSVPEVEMLTELGAVLLMFTIGLEFSLKQMIQIKGKLLRLGLFQVVGTILLVGSICYGIFEIPWNRSLFFGALASLSSTAVVFKLLHDSRDIDSPYGKVGVSILLFQDLAVIFMILALPVLSRSPGFSFSAITWEGAGMFLSKALGLVAFVVLGARYGVHILLDRVAKTKSREVFFFSLIFICVGTAYFMEMMGLSLSLGAFFAGIMVSESPYGRQATSDILPLRDIFLGLFFVAIGMLVDTGFLLSRLHILLGITMIVIVTKVFVISLAVRLFERSAALATVCGLILFQLGEFSFVLMEQGKGLGLMSALESQYFLGVSIITLALTPLFYSLAPQLGFHPSFRDIIPQQVRKWRDKLHIPDQSQDKKGAHDEEKPSGSSGIGHTVIIGFGIAGQNVAFALKELKIPYKIVELDNDTVKKYSARGESIVFGDASHRKILNAVGIDEANLVIVAVAGVHVCRGVLDTIHRVRPDVQMIVRTAYLRDLRKIGLSDRVDPVIAEFETTLEILVRALRVYGVSAEDTQKFVLESHQRLGESFHQSFEGAKSQINLPDWQSFTYFKPFQVKAHHYACGKTLTQLDLRKATDVTIVSVYREGQGTTVPSVDLEIMSRDVLYLIGRPDELQRAETYLTKATTTPPNIPG